MARRAAAVINATFLLPGTYVIHSRTKGEVQFPFKTSTNIASLINPTRKNTSRAWVKNFKIYVSLSWVDSISYFQNI